MDIDDQQNEDESLSDFFIDLINILIKGIKESIIFWGIIILIFLLIAPNHIYPMIGKCYSGEGISRCYFRIQSDLHQIKEFTLCQDSCGRGIGIEICLENCEMTHSMGKWKLTRTYVSLSGDKIECPVGYVGIKLKSGKMTCEPN